MRVWVLCLLLVQAWAAHGVQLDATASNVAVKHEDELATLQGFHMGRRLMKKKPKCKYGRHPRTGGCLPFCKWGYTARYTCKPKPKPICFYGTDRRGRCLPKPKCRWGWDRFFRCNKAKPVCRYGYDKDFNCLAQPNCPYGYSPDLKRCLPAPLPASSPVVPIVGR